MSVEIGQSRLDSFLERRLKYRSLRPQFIIGLVAGILFVGDLAAGFSSLVGTDGRVVYNAVAYAIGVIYLFVPIAVWWASTVVAFAITRSVGGQGDFGVMLRATGWGLVPFAFACGFLAVGRYVGARAVDACALETIACDQGAYVKVGEQVDAIFSLMVAAAGHPTFEIFYALAALCFLLTGYFWAIALQKATTLTRQGALVAVAPPVLLVTVGFTFVTL